MTFRAKNRGMAVPTVLRFVLMLILAGVVFGFFSMTYSEFIEGRDRSELKRNTEDLAELIESFKNQSSGGQAPYDIDIPKNSMMKFEGENVVCISGKRTSYRTGIEIEGPNLDPGSYHLMVIKNEGNVEIKVG